MVYLFVKWCNQPAKSFYRLVNYTDLGLFGILLLCIAPCCSSLYANVGYSRNIFYISLTMYLLSFLGLVAFIKSDRTNTRSQQVYAASRVLILTAFLAYLFFVAISLRKSTSPSDIVEGKKMLLGLLLCSAPLLWYVFYLSFHMLKVCKVAGYGQTLVGQGNNRRGVNVSNSLARLIQNQS